MKIIYTDCSVLVLIKYCDCYTFTLTKEIRPHYFFTFFSHHSMTFHIYFEVTFALFHESQSLSQCIFKAMMMLQLAIYVISNLNYHHTKNVNALSNRCPLQNKCNLISDSYVCIIHLYTKSIQHYNYHYYDHRQYEEDYQLSYYEGSQKACFI